MDLIVTSGGLGPTADDLTAEVVGAFQGREMVLDEALEERIAEILEPLRDALAATSTRRRCAPATASRRSSPRARRCSSPSAPRPGSSCRPPRARRARPSSCCPGPPRELQPMWRAAVATDAFRARGRRRGRATASEMLRLFGIPESEIAETLRVAERRRHRRSSALEITTCLRRGEVEVVTRYEPAGRGGLRRASPAIVRERHADTLFSDDGATVDEQVARAAARRAA